MALAQSKWQSQGVKKPNQFGESGRTQTTIASAVRAEHREQLAQAPRAFSLHDDSATGRHQGGATCPYPRKPRVDKVFWPTVPFVKRDLFLPRS
jgi:hypothetical protein